MSGSLRLTQQGEALSDIAAHTPAGLPHMPGHRPTAAQLQGMSWARLEISQPLKLFQHPRPLGCSPHRGPTFAACMPQLTWMSKTMPPMMTTGPAECLCCPSPVASVPSRSSLVGRRCLTIFASRCMCSYPGNHVICIPRSYDVVKVTRNAASVWASMATSRDDEAVSEGAILLVHPSCGGNMRSLLHENEIDWTP